ncbi:rod shape-determining protein MreC [Candidatus Synechococcus calcipolaris G9]|uniref:Cell shape-determining protein MreC n=1 Tax=Candidatus Synechococcus calcipolaris G9 TaxID=1497997 RepID=A0ABT6EX97_9SYNE|nr:rod shape-determining protein MreC [Candidatus Synechococcus calcipolaris]MDG2990401.1 rod shape-determining protein MreC [Candidatus Synechococcus calcipolaris G9]
MAVLLRWWGRHWGAVFFAGVALGTAWVIKETNGAGIRELYRLLTVPVQSNIQSEEQLIQARTWQLEQQLNEVRSENERLRQLLNVPAIAHQNALLAPVIGRSAAQWWQSILLGQGSRQGVGIGDVVMADGGLVGRITSITPNTSRVLLLTDPSSRVGVMVSRTRQMGILRGQLGNEVIIEFLEKDPQVQPKDTILTSALSSLFPAGIPVGEVQSVELSDPTRPHATVRLGAAIDRLEWVKILPHDNSSEPVLDPN